MMDTEKDYVIVAEMVTAKHGKIEFVSHGNGVWARKPGHTAIPRHDWSASMQAVVGGLPKELVYWEKSLAEYKERGYA